MASPAMRHWDTCLTLVIQPNVTLLFNGVTSREALGHVSLFNGVTSNEALGQVSDSCDKTECHFALQWRHQHETLGQVSDL